MVVMWVEDEGGEVGVLLCYFDKDGSKQDGLARRVCCFRTST